VDLDERALKKILTEPKNALVKQYQRLFEMESVDLTLDEEALWAISKKAITRKTGARGLRLIMESILLDIMFDLPDLEGVKEVVISRQVVGARKGPARAQEAAPDATDVVRIHRRAQLSRLAVVHPVGQKVRRSRRISAVRRRSSIMIIMVSTKSRSVSSSTLPCSSERTS
jgi:hypothetical protein